MLRALLLGILLFAIACSHPRSEELQNAESTARPASIVDTLAAVCLAESSPDPIEIFEHVVSLPGCRMHGPDHHAIVGACLLTAYRNAGGEVDLERALPEMIRRGQQVPGGACGSWGACGAAISTGIFMSIVTENSPFATESWHLSNLITAEALEQVANNGGPRCCKRDSYLSILAAARFVQEHLGVRMRVPEVRCSRSSQNAECIGRRCPFSVPAEGLDTE